MADLDFEGDARAAALDLSLADGRFAPDVLEIAARRAVDAWAEAIDGDDRRSNAIADREAVDQTAASRRSRAARTRLVVRGPRVRQIRITGLDAAAEPPTMTIDVELEGRRYIEDRDTAARRLRQPVTRDDASPSTGRSRSPATPRSRGGSSRVGAPGPAARRALRRTGTARPRRGRADD